MSVSKELLERYHLDKCSVEECRQIEEWLFNTDVDELKLPLDQDKQILKAEIWKDINISHPHNPKIKKIKSPTYYMWKGAVAASLFFIISASIVYFSIPSKAEFVSLNNSSANQVRQIYTAGYSVSVGPNTIASINDERHLINLKGSLLISAKKDVELVFQGTNKKLFIKKGQTYLLLKNIDGSNEVIVVNTQNLFDLSPVMQRQISSYFEI